MYASSEFMRSLPTDLVPNKFSIYNVSFNLRSLANVNPCLVFTGCSSVNISCLPVFVVILRHSALPLFARTLN